MRRKNSFDVRLPGDAVTIHTVDKTPKDPARITGTDGAAGAMRRGRDGPYTVLGSSRVALYALYFVTGDGIVPRMGRAPTRRHRKTMELLIDAFKSVLALGAVIVLIVLLPFLMMWFFRRISIGTQKTGLNTIRKVRN